MIKVPQYTDEQLSSFSVHQRHEIYKKARALGTPEALALCDRIERSGLPFSDSASLRSNDPIVQKMAEVIFSPEAVAAALEATNKGLPALAGIDPLLSEVLGVDYGSHNDGTMNAGFIVAEMMRTRGFKNSGRKGKLPPTCVAKTAEIFVPNKSGG
jgi:hypothetical protein